MTELVSDRILLKPAIDRKLRRMAYEIYERNAGERAIVVAGIRGGGQVIATRLVAHLKEIAPFSIRHVELSIDKQHPGPVEVSEELDFNGQVVIVVDDVANSGRTLLYALKPLLEALPRRIQTAVLIDRSHKAFPITADYIGHSLSTTLQEHVEVEIQDGEVVAVSLR